jgi:flagellar capping protein FliD
LHGDPVIQTLPIRLSRAVTRHVAGLPDGTPSTLLELGITTASDGTLSLSNDSRLAEAIEQHGVEAIASVFNHDGEEPDDGLGIARRLETLLDDYLAGPRLVGGHELAGPLGLLETQLDTWGERLSARIEREEERLAQREAALRRRLAHTQDLASSLLSQQSAAQSLLGGLLGG